MYQYGHCIQEIIRKEQPRIHRLVMVGVLKSHLFSSYGALFEHLAGQQCLISMYRCNIDLVQTEVRDDSFLFFFFNQMQLKSPAKLPAYYLSMNGALEFSFDAQRQRWKVQSTFTYRIFDTTKVMYFTSNIFSLGYVRFSSLYHRIGRA